MLRFSYRMSFMCFQVLSTSSSGWNQENCFKFSMLLERLLKMKALNYTLIYKFKTLFLNIFINSLSLEFYTVTLLSKCFSSYLLFYMLKAKLRSQPYESPMWQFSRHLCV